MKHPVYAVDSVTIQLRFLNDISIKNITSIVLKIAFEWTLSRVRSYMYSQIALLLESLITVLLSSNM